MRKFMLFLSGCMACSQVLMAGLCDKACNGWPSASTSCAADWPSSINIDFGAGYRNDKFEWSIAGFDDVPNILSKLQWKDLRIAQIGGSASYVSCRNYAIRLEADYGRIYHGKVYDADYAESDQTDLFSYSLSKAGKGHVYDVSAAVGYRVTSTYARFVATPLIGYSQHAQYLHLYNGYQLFPFQFDIAGLNSTYSARWYGPWIGVDFEARVERCAYLFGGFEWHMAAYRGHGKWNLRHDIGPFHHKAYGMGYVATLGGKWEIWNNWAIGITGNYRNFRTRHGHEYLVVNVPIFGPIKVRSRFNQAKWHTYSVSGIITWRF